MFESSLKSIQQKLLAEVSSTSEEVREGDLSDGTPSKGKKPVPSNRPTRPTSVVLECSIGCCGPPPEVSGQAILVVPGLVTEWKAGLEEQLAKGDDIS